MRNLDLAEFLSVIWRSKWIILVIAVATTAYVAFHELSIKTEYETSAILTVVSSGSNGPLGSASGLDQTANVDADLLQLDEVAQASAKKGGLDIDPVHFKNALSTSVEKGKPYLTITATDTNQQTAVDEANAAANGLAQYVADQNSNNLAVNRKNLLDQLTQVENSMNALHGDPNKTDQLLALNDVRDSIIKQDEQVNVDMLLTRLNVLSAAKDVSTVPTQKSRNILLAFAVSIVAGTALGFVFESVKNSLRHQV